MLPAQAATTSKELATMPAIYKTLQSELNKALAEEAKYFAQRAKHSFEQEQFRMYEALLTGERAKVFALQQSMDQELNASGAKEAIDQFNNGLITLKELANKLVSIEVELNK